MSQQNVEIVRRSFEAFARGDFETAFASYSPEAEWRTAADEPDPQTFRGIAALKDFASSLSEPWLDRFDDEVVFEGFIDCGEWVVVPWTAQVRGRGSGIAIELRETYAVELREAAIVRVEEYRSREQALEAVGRRR